MSLGALLAACSGDDDSPTGERRDLGGAARPPPSRRAARSDLASRFDESATCAQTAELTEGPFYFDIERGVRSDIREDREGAKLRLGVRVREAGACEPIHNAVVDIWHCDAYRSYWGSRARRARERPVRGAQVTNTRRDRGVHHGLSRLVPGPDGAHPREGPHRQGDGADDPFCFSDDFSAKVFEAEPYASDTGRDTFNDNDSLYSKELELTLSEEDGGASGLITLDVA